MPCASPAVPAFDDRDEKQKVQDGLSGVKKAEMNAA